MNNYTFEKNGYTFERVNKTTARNMYNAGESVYLIPVNANPFFVGFGYPFEIKTDDPAGDEYRTTAAVMEYSRPEFDTRVMYFEIYNCVDELGKYAAYYRRIA